MARGIAPLALLGLGIGATAITDVADGRGVRAGETLIDRSESAIQSLRVVELRDAEGNPSGRQLRVNESFDSFQSVWTPARGLLPQGHYYNLFALAPAWSARETAVPLERWRTFIIGLGAGTAIRVMEGTKGPETQLEFVGAEIDPEVLRLGAEHFELGGGEASKTELIGGLDGRAGLRLAQGTFDQIIVDAYSNNMEIPSHLVTVEAFREMHERLSVGGWVTVNVGGFDAHDPVVERVAASVGAAFGADRTAIARVAFSRNWMVFARKDAALPEPGGREFGSRGPALPNGLDSLIGPLEVSGAWQRIGDNVAAPLTDNCSPTETLQAASIRRAKERLDALDVIRLASPLVSTPVEGLTAGSADENARRSAETLYGEGRLAAALEAAADIDDPVIGPNLRARYLWAAGAPVAALELAAANVRNHGGAASDPERLKLIADLGYTVGATRLAHAALVRLRERLGASPGEWWDAALAGLREQDEQAAEHGGLVAKATSRAKLLLGVVVALALLGLALVLRR